jgi:hypothetical protein
VPALPPSSTRAKPITAADLAKAEQAWLTVRYLIRWFGIGFCALMTYWSIDRLAGATTVVDVFVNLFGSFRGRMTGAFGLLAVFGCGWGWQERKLRLSKVAYLTSRIRELERTIDPKRSGSKLTEEGNTNPKDQ